MEQVWQSKGRLVFLTTYTNYTSEYCNQVRNETTFLLAKETGGI